MKHVNWRQLREVARIRIYLDGRWIGSLLRFYSEPVERPISSIGTGVKHSMKITSVPNATQYRRLSKGI